MHQLEYCLEVHSERLVKYAIKILDGNPHAPEGKTATRGQEKLWLIDDCHEIPNTDGIKSPTWRVRNMLRRCLERIASLPCGH